MQDGGMNCIFEEFDKVYKEYREYVAKQEWGNANDARNYMLGMGRCMQLLYKKEMGQLLGQEILRRCELATGRIHLN